MKELGRWAALTLALAIVLHLVVVWALPRVIMEVALLVVSPANQMNYREPVTAAHRDVVRQSPDLLYSSCHFDVSDGPVLLTAAVPDGYFSISMFTTNTDNFFAINDLMMDGAQMKLVLVREGTDYAAKQGEKVVTTPSNRGLALFRLLIEDPAQIDQLVALQKRARCQSLPR
jgi:uncharacterized membrane protein